MMKSVWDTTVILVKAIPALCVTFRVVQGLGMVTSYLRQLLPWCAIC